MVKKYVQKKPQDVSGAHKLRDEREKNFKKYPHNRTGDIRDYFKGTKNL